MTMPKDKTFSHDETLPPLKVPDLENTIEKYLESVKAVANQSEYKNTKKVCQKFLKTSGPKLQQILKEREKYYKNWIEEWWLQVGYLDLRMPLSYINFTGATLYSEQFWPPQDGTQLKRMALSMHVFANFYNLLRNEEIEVHKAADGTIFAMDQLRTIFNTSQIPGKDRDTLNCRFKTVSEGTSPLHAIVIYNGRLFQMNLFNPTTGEPYTPPQLEIAATFIVRQCDSSTSKVPGIAALTSLPRDTWADVREHFVAISQQNELNLNVIDTAVAVFSIDGTRADTLTDVMLSGLAGDPVQRWRDKSYNEVWSRNGTTSTCCAHSATDGMVLVMYMEFATHCLLKCNGCWKGVEDTSSENVEVNELSFDVDGKILDSIEEAKQVAAKFRDDLWLKVLSFSKFGKIKIKELKVFPDALVQVSLQLAYMRMHGKPASTYETATTRKFYHGRTETCRTCTPELVDFCRAAIESGHNEDVRVCALLTKACERFRFLMKECRNNRGCDRHLSGLAVAAKENGTETPELFSDPMFTKSGGDGNFVLSTSFVGYSYASGAVSPMVDDGYGAFYRIGDHRIDLDLSSWRYSKETNLHTFAEHVERALCDVFQMFRHIHERQL